MAFAHPAGDVEQVKIRIRKTEDVELAGSPSAAAEQIFTREALDFICRLHDQFDSTRKMLLVRRQERQRQFDQDRLPDFLPSTESIRSGNWKVAPAPDDLNDRRVEITGPVERKMMINALNSGAKVFMADFEDSLSPTWENVSEGQVNLYDAVRRTIEFSNPKGKAYRLNDKTATLVVRPRGWHLEDKYVLVRGEPVSASLLDFGLYFFHNAKELSQRGSGPYFYLPKLQSHLEARLWDDVFVFSQKELGIPHGTIRATVLIETLPAAFEMEEILYELRDHAAGLNAGRWDYIFSLIKTLRSQKESLLPDRGQITMTVPFMRAYTELLVKTCHRRGAHAIGGMAAFIPNRKDAKVTQKALEKVREDKTREAGDGFDGTWVAHPDLVPVAMEIFDSYLSDRLNQKDRSRDEVQVKAEQLLDIRVPGGRITAQGVSQNIDVALQYIDSWLQGVGAAAIYNLMEDAATAEISRAELWQWVHHGAKLEDGRRMTPALFSEFFEKELQKLGGRSLNRLRDASEILSRIVLNSGLADFLTIPAYEILMQGARAPQPEERGGLRTEGGDDDRAAGSSDQGSGTQVV